MVNYRECQLLNIVSYLSGEDTLATAIMTREMPLERERTVPSSSNQRASMKRSYRPMTAQLSVLIPHFEHRHTGREPMYDSSPQETTLHNHSYSNLNDVLHGQDLSKRSHSLRWGHDHRIPIEYSRNSNLDQHRVSHLEIRKNRSAKSRLSEKKDTRGVAERRVFRTVRNQPEQLMILNHSAEDCTEAPHPSIRPKSLPVRLVQNVCNVNQTGLSAGAYPSTAKIALVPLSSQCPQVASSRAFPLNGEEDKRTGNIFTRRIRCRHRENTSAPAHYSACAQRLDSSRGFHSINFPPSKDTKCAPCMLIQQSSTRIRCIPDVDVRESQVHMNVHSRSNKTGAMIACMVTVLRYHQVVLRRRLSIRTLRRLFVPRMRFRRHVQEREHYSNRILATLGQKNDSHKLSWTTLAVQSWLMQRLRDYCGGLDACLILLLSKGSQHIVPPNHIIWYRGQPVVGGGLCVVVYGSANLYELDLSGAERICKPNNGCKHSSDNSPHLVFGEIEILQERIYQNTLVAGSCGCIYVMIPSSSICEIYGQEIILRLQHDLAMQQKLEAIRTADFSATMLRSSNPLLHSISDEAIQYIRKQSELIRLCGGRVWSLASASSYVLIPTQVGLYERYQCSVTAIKNVDVGIGSAVGLAEALGSIIPHITLFHYNQEESSNKRVFDESIFIHDSDLLKRRTALYARTNVIAWKFSTVVLLRALQISFLPARFPVGSGIAMAKKRIWNHFDSTSTYSYHPNLISEWLRQHYPTPIPRIAAQLLTYIVDENHSYCSHNRDILCVPFPSDHVAVGEARSIFRTRDDLQNRSICNHTPCRMVIESMFYDLLINRARMEYYIPEFRDPLRLCSRRLSGGNSRQAFFLSEGFVHVLLWNPESRTGSPVKQSSARLESNLHRTRQTESCENFSDCPPVRNYIFSARSPTYDNADTSLQPFVDNRMYASKKIGCEDSEQIHTSVKQPVSHSIMYAPSWIGVEQLLGKSQDATSIQNNMEIWITRPVVVYSIGIDVLRISHIAWHHEERKNSSNGSTTPRSTARRS